MKTYKQFYSKNKIKKKNFASHVFNKDFDELIVQNTCILS